MFAGVDASGVDEQLAAARPQDAAALARDAQRSENRCAATKVFAARRLFDLRRVYLSKKVHRDVFGSIGDKGATVEVATTLGVSTGVASSWVDLAYHLDNLPDLRATFITGDIDLPRVKAIAGTIAHIEGDVTRKILETAAVDFHGAAMSTREITGRLDRLLIELDPEQAAAQRRAFERHQDIKIRPDRHGHSTIDGCVPADLGAELEARISALTAPLCPDDPRSAGQRRVAAVRAMARHETSIACLCGERDCPDSEPTADDAETGTTASTDLVPVKAQVMVHVDAATLAGMRGEMVPYIDGHGPIDPDYARLLAADATWQGLYADATHTDGADLSATGFRRGTTRTAGVIRDGFDTNAGHHPPPGPPAAALRYSPSQSLRDWITWADGTCRFIGCDHPAESCDIDHVIPFDHANPSAGGWTVRINLAALCRLHHHLKTVELWRAVMHADRSITWTNSETGEQFTTYPKHDGH